jgi:hypothetical protein
MYITDSRGLETDLRWFPLSVPIKTKKKRSCPQLDRNLGDTGFQIIYSRPGPKPYPRANVHAVLWVPGGLLSPVSQLAPQCPPFTPTPVEIDRVRISIVLVGHPFPRDFLWIYNISEFCLCPSSLALTHTACLVMFCVPFQCCWLDDATRICYRDFYFLPIFFSDVTVRLVALLMGVRLHVSAGA